jgi:hypothetical protein
MHARFPAAEQAGLAEYFRGYGADPDTAARMATAVSKDPGTALKPSATGAVGDGQRTGCPQPRAMPALALARSAVTVRLRLPAGLPSNPIGPNLRS